jgi:DNA-binding NarL/FixJ family response regulator
MTPIRILLVDDHEMVREGLKAILHSDADLLVVAETGSGGEVPALIESAHPDIVLLDARLPDISGPDVCRLVRHTYPKVRVLMLSTYTDDALVEECILAGAHGYVVKDVERFSLKESLRAVARGHSVLAPEVAGRVMERVRAGQPPTLNAPGLNQSQLAILRLMSRGFSNRDIASEIHLSENTVKTHVQEIFRKLGVHNRVEAAITATKNHWV